ncbi:MAG TPA: hypothetical protein VIH00_05770 [Candidatus Limnocylindrales bacterium]
MWRPDLLPRRSGSQTRVARRLLLTGGLIIGLAACGGTTEGPGWTFAPGSAQPSGDAQLTPAPSQSGTFTPVPTTGAPPAGSETPRPFAGRMSNQLVLQDGQLSMYMLLENTGLAPLTFLNTLYDDEPDQLWTPTVAFPWTSGETALITRSGRFFPSPTIVGPGQSAVYLMGGQEVTGQGELARPVANIKFCPTRGMDDEPGVPVAVDDIAWSASGGITTVSGTMRETLGSSRPSLPIVGVAFFDAADAFVGAIVANRVGDALSPGEIRTFEISGPGVATDRIDHAQAYAFIP